MTDSQGNKLVIMTFGEFQVQNRPSQDVLFFICFPSFLISCPINLYFKWDQVVRQANYGANV